MSYEEHPRKPANQLDSWQSLEAHKQVAEKFVMRDLFAQDPNRFEKFTVQAAGLSLDYSKNLITEETQSLLLNLAESCHLKEAIDAMFNGDIINRSEGRPVLHIALRKQDSQDILVDGKGIMSEVRETLSRIETFCNKVHSGEWQGFTGKKITDIVSIGIGGSFLGPMMVGEALTPFHVEGIQCHYVANVDSSDIAETLKKLDRETTLFVVASKTFTTQETLKNAETSRNWFLDSDASESDIAKHFVAVSTNLDAVSEFGILPENAFPIWDWVGGRYSLWSAIGLPLALTIGFDQFKEVLEGAYLMDEHYRTAPFNENLPVLLGTLGIWYSNFFGSQSQVVLAYDHYMQELPAHLQQLDMESNGKAVNLLGESLAYPSGTVIWGGVGTNGQHAYHQLLHQGTHLIPADFILPLKTHNPITNHHALLVANCLAQSQAMMQGKTEAEALEELLSSGMDADKAKTLASHKVIPGNRPCNTLFMETSNPKTVGALIALYEHKVHVQGTIWGINSFDQWGVELGKQLGKMIYPALSGGQTDKPVDSSTQGLVDAYLKANA